MSNTRTVRLIASVGLAVLFCGRLSASAQTAPPLGVLSHFGILGNSGVTGSTGLGTVIQGDVGSSPTPSISNFPPSSVTPGFAVHFTNDSTVQQAHSDAIAAYNFLAAEGPGTVLPAQLDGAVLTSGIYSFAGGAADLAGTGTLTLNGPGIFVFQVDSALTANVNSNVLGTADPCSVYWRVGSSATLNGITFRGNVIANASATVGSGSNVTGRAIAGTGATGAVTMAGAGGNTVGGCTGGVISPTEIPALDGFGMAALVALLALAGLLLPKRISS
ncbi:MAG TPA: ice-binding family protein [Thermoanaerobaculia bacterium]|nr:ice-binding family protein [Thermoanaerobaculia bacterium]